MGAHITEDIQRKLQSELESFKAAQKGRAIKAKICEGLIKREDIFVTGKLWPHVHRSDLVEPALRSSLRDLQLEYIDLYLMHWPFAFKEELQKAISTRQQLDGQLNENEIVKNELHLLPEDGKVYKSVGPVLIKTDLVEAKQNVSKRMDYINKELKKVDDLISSLEKKQDSHRESLSKLQQQFQQAQLKAALHAPA